MADTYTNATTAKYDFGQIVDFLDQMKVETEASFADATGVYCEQTVQALAKHYARRGETVPSAPDSATYAALVKLLPHVRTATLRMQIGRVTGEIEAAAVEQLISKDEQQVIHRFAAGVPGDEREVKKLMQNVFRCQE